MTNTSTGTGDLNGVHVAILATDGFEEAELTEPLQALREAGVQVDILSSKTGQIQAFRHHDKSIQMPVDKPLDQAQPGDYDALVLSTFSRELLTLLVRSRRGTASASR